MTDLDFYSECGHMVGNCPTSCNLGRAVAAQRIIDELQAALDAVRAIVDPFTHRDTGEVAS